MVSFGENLTALRNLNDTAGDDGLGWCFGDILTLKENLSTGRL